MPRRVARFLDLVAERGAQLESVPHPTERGAEGEELAIDVATFGDPRPARRSSSSRAPTARRDSSARPCSSSFFATSTFRTGVNVVALHALNPWGFSHHSRTDEDNIDLNRNFLDHDAPFPRNDLYRELFPTLCPEDWTEETSDWSGVLDEMVRVHGPQQMITALSGGQAVEPTGITYVGDRPAWSHTVVADVLPRVLANAEKVAFIEWHTGIGEWGELAHICSLPVGVAGSRAGGRVAGGVGPHQLLLLGPDVGGAHPVLHRLLLRLAAQHRAAGGVVRTPDRGRHLRQPDRAQHRAHRPVAEVRHRADLHLTRGDADLMMEGLNPAAPAWREAAMTNGLDAQKRMLEGLARW